MSQEVYLNGRFVPADEASVSIYDAGLLHGVGLFETMRSYNGVVFRARQHMERLYRSAEMLEIKTPGPPEQLVAAMHELLRRNEIADARVRLTLTPGSVRPATAEQPSEPTVLITAVPIEPHPAQLYEKGVTVLVSPWKQSKHDPTCGHKVLGYMARLLALRKAQELDCIEAVWFTTDNLLAEGSISNVFLVKDSRVLTPPLETPVLPGVTRAAVIQIAAANEIDLVEQPLTIHDLLGADEVFLTNTSMEVMPVCRIERHPVGDEKPGPVSRRLLQLFRDLVRRECSENAES